jgi:integrase
MKLFEGWVKAKQPADRTVNRWRAVFQDLELKFPELAELTDDTAQTWARSCITAERGARTVRDVWVNSAHTVFEWAKGERLIAHNPFAAVTVTVPRKIKTRETDAFTAEEAKTILNAALQVTNTEAVFSAAKRWVPWLCAYSGARVSEITQLRGSDVQARGTFHAMRLTPEAGSIKTRKPRTVPLHEHLIEQGFLDYVQKRGKGPLFYNTRTAAVRSRSMNPKRSRSVVTANRLAAWVRSKAVGITDKELQPNHAWRDTFKQIAERHGISETRA